MARVAMMAFSMENGSVGRPCITHRRIRTGSPKSYCRVTSSATVMFSSLRMLIDNLS